LSRPLIIVTDTSLLINFLHVDGIGVMARHSHGFIITDHVVEEITDHYEKQRTALAQAIKSGALQQVSLTSEDDLLLFAKLMQSGRLGTGESSAIACAINSHHKLATDDKPAIAQAKAAAKDLEILRTQDLVVSMIQEKLITVKDADHWKVEWETKYRFKLKIESFGDLI
jgi:predicted nucleic acid-binding protein